MRLNSRHLLWLIALAVVVAVVLLLLIRPPVAAPEAGGQPPSSDPTGSQDLIPPPDPVPWAAVEWHALEEPFAADEPPLIRMDGVVDAGDLIVGWGRASTPARNQFNDMGAVLVSRDGRSWSTVLIEDGVEPANTSELTGVAAGPHGYLAYGGVCCEPEQRAVWHSSDGLAWERQQIVGEMDRIGGSFASVVGVASGWVAVGNAWNGQEGQIWVSSDGADWELMDGDLGSATLSDVSMGSDGLIAVGTVDGPDGTYDAGIWTSPNGRTWQRIGAGDPALAGVGEAQLWGVVAHAGGYFVTGMYGSTEAREQCEQLGMVASADPRPPETALSCATGTEHHWVSRDGNEWERIDPMDAPGEHPVEFRIVVAGGPGLIVFGESSGPASPDTTLFSSPDGKRWSAIGPRQPIGNGVAIGLVVRDRQIIAVADHFGGNRSEVRLWSGSAN